ncbi:tautomerase family protein [Pseudomonas sp. LRF_L74]|uniref:tautomerase family protein n=1 Tax=Pseudomonas sp. LRF_L74 TaxID=3369422 RepID=UPI003F6475DC
MPIVNFHLLDGQLPADREAALLEGATRIYCEVLGAPPERIRALISRHAPKDFAVAGALCSAGGVHAPFFEFYVLQGRTADDRQALMAGFTELLVGTLGVRREEVRGVCRQVAADDWCIGGVPASVQRASEIAARAEGVGHGA